MKKFSLMALACLIVFCLVTLPTYAQTGPGGAATAKQDAEEMLAEMISQESDMDDAKDSCDIQYALALNWQDYCEMNDLDEQKAAGDPYMTQGVEAWLDASYWMSQADQKQTAGNSHYQVGLTAYQNSDWPIAIARFGSALSLWTTAKGYYFQAMIGFIYAEGRFNLAMFYYSGGGGGIIL